MADIVSAKINHVVDPRRYPVDDVEGCRPIDLTNHSICNPFWDKDDDGKTRYVTGSELYEMHLAKGWKAITIGWVREDGSTNFGQPPCVNQRLIAVMVKLKEKKD